MPGYSIPSNYAFQAMPQVSMSHSQGQMTQAMSAPVTRVPSWDFTTYVDTSPASAHDGNMHGMFNRHTNGINQSFSMPPTTYSMAPPSSGI